MTESLAALLAPAALTGASGAFAALPNETNPLVPEYQLLVNGLPLPLHATGDLTEILVRQDVDAPGMFAFTLLNWDMETLRFLWSDDRQRFYPGASVKIALGYLGKLSPVIEGEITALEPEFSADRAATLTVRGYDLRHRMLRSRRTAVYQKKSDPQIAEEIARHYNLLCQADPSTLVHDYVLQQNQSDLAFLQERARRIGFEVAMDGARLLFRKPPVRDAPALVLQHEDNLIEFFPRLTVAGPSAQLEVRAWSVQDKAPIVATAGRIDQTPMATSVKGGMDLGEAGKARIVDVPVATAAEARALAQSRFNAAALGYIAGPGRCIGNSALAAGQVVLIKGVGERFGGAYYLTGVTHTYRPGSGFVTAFEARRNAT